HSDFSATRADDHAGARRVPKDRDSRPRGYVVSSGIRQRDRERTRHAWSWRSANSGNYFDDAALGNRNGDERIGDGDSVMNWPWVSRRRLIEVQAELTQEGKDNVRLQSDLSDARAQIRELKTDRLTPTIEELEKKIKIAELEGQLRVLEEQVHIRKEFGMPGERGQTLIAKVQRVAAEERAKLAAK